MTRHTPLTSPRSAARLLVVSDLHLEQRPAWSLPDALPPFDVAVAAGDVDGSPERAVRGLAAAPALAGRPVVLIAGNHEFYGGAIDGHVAAGRAACAGTTVRFLARDAVVLAGVRFLGATLWTDYALYGDEAAAMAACRFGMSDHGLIEVGPPGRRRTFQPEDAAALHAGDPAFIEAELARPFSGPTVVVTHHAPHPGSVAPRWAGSAMTPGFVSDLTGAILKGRPTLWVHGHNHDSFDYRVGGTRILANPKGYGPLRPGALSENPAFDPCLVVDLPSKATQGDTGHAADPFAVEESAPGPPATGSVTLRIARWSLVRVRDRGTVHVLGYRADTMRGRSSSPVRRFDRATRTATTVSGNRYVLVGEAGDGLHDPVVLAWLAMQDLVRREVEIVDVETL